MATYDVYNLGKKADTMIEQSGGIKKEGTRIHLDNGVFMEWYMGQWIITQVPELSSQEKTQASAGRRS